MRVRNSYSAFLLTYYNYILKKIKLKEISQGQAEFWKLPEGSKPKWITLILVGKAKGARTVQRGEGRMFDRVSRPAAKWTHGLIHKLLQVTVGLSWAEGGKVCSGAQEGTMRTSGGSCRA